MRSSVESRWPALGLIALLSACGSQAPANEVDDSASDATTTAPTMVATWNTRAVDASGLDHTHPAPGDPRHFGEQLGPARSSRAMAIVHIAMFDAANSINGNYQSYTRIGSAPGGTTMGVAMAQAAHDTLSALYPSQKAAFDAELASDLKSYTGSSGKAKGVAVGQKAAAAILALRTGDGSEIADPVVGQTWPEATGPGQWRPDPITKNMTALGAYWGLVKPFVLRNGSQYRAPAPPLMTSAAYTTAYNEVKSYGGDGLSTPTVRTQLQSDIGTFWAYDGTPSLCAPPRLYNQVAMAIAKKKGTTGNALELARYLALLNVVMADTAIAIWDSKFHYNFWRPVAGIRESDQGTGLSGLGDGNPGTIGDVLFMPLGAPASNTQGLNFTPPFPSYPSGHAGFGGALFEAIRNYYGRDDVAFDFTSDEFNGTTLDNGGKVRRYWPRHFDRLSDAEEENGQSRIYLGIHWSFDKTEGIALGHKVADEVTARVFNPVGWYATPGQETARVVASEGGQQ